MKKRIFTIFGLTIVCASAILIASSLETIGGTSVYARTNGSEINLTGSPIDGFDCTDCHGATLNAGAGTYVITSTVPVAGYVPGTVYTVSVGCQGADTPSGTPVKIGVEVTSESASAKVGTVTITDAARTQSVGGKGIVHTTAGTTPLAAGTNGWSYDWTAPATGTGAITFYACFVVGDGVGSGGDAVHTTTYSITEATVDVQEIASTSSVSIYPNPAVNYFQLSSTTNVENVEVYNLSGQRVLEQNSNLEKINIEGLSSGVYFVRINSNNGSKVEKLTVN